MLQEREEPSRGLLSLLTLEFVESLLLAHQPKRKKRSGTSNVMSLNFQLREKWYYLIDVGIIEPV